MFRASVVTEMLSAAEHFVTRLTRDFLSRLCALATGSSFLTRWQISPFMFLYDMPSKTTVRNKSLPAISTFIYKRIHDYLHYLFTNELLTSDWSARNRYIE